MHEDSAHGKGDVDFIHKLKSKNLFGEQKFNMIKTNSLSNLRTKVNNISDFRHDYNSRPTSQTVKCC
ncbi:hypothetical protein L596_030806 [Steinernema carpocapsae]|uniref:Uncharacterized protein n=1 Tax=Steinernema carpocapsae TaxID=34508 RepID=A0A4U5LNU3_STECR|nr:hypothetical protein L596_030806 [Steinernema carpocapsae]